LLRQDRFAYERKPPSPAKILIIAKTVDFARSTASWGWLSPCPGAAGWTYAALGGQAMQSSNKPGSLRRSLYRPRRDVCAESRYSVPEPQSLSVPEVWLLIVPRPVSGVLSVCFPGVAAWWCQGCPGRHRLRPRRAVSPFVSLGFRAGQAGAGMAKSRCQQV